MERSTRCSWLSSVTSKVYLAHAITTWGDRMWNFAIALFLVKMVGTYSLRLTAIYGLVTCTSTIVLGTAIGKWIDGVPRMTAAVKALVIQNSSVVICALILCVVIYSNDGNMHGKEQDWLFRVAQVFVIFFGALANLASVGSNISITKDWVVVIVEKDKERLAAINAMCRTIDLTCKICSPFLVGFIMSHMSNLAAAIFIASWNVVSMVGEYSLLRSIYRAVPALALKNVVCDDDGEVNPDEADTSLATTNGQLQRLTDEQPAPKLKSSSSRGSIHNYLLSWRAYFNHHIFLAGLGLACLYLTVLAFDGITMGYAFSQGIPESVLGALGGGGALVGIVGTYAYPRLRRRFGLECTGSLGFFFEVICLLPCVAAIWAPGSPFDPTCILSGTSPSCLLPSSTTESPVLAKFGGNATATGNITVVSGNTPIGPGDYTSIVLLMIGIVLARFGLWLADLTINQIIQEEVKESQRGSINGSQYSLNTAMNLVKFCLVILFPYPKTFGLLALISFAVICLGWVSYTFYCWKKGVSCFSVLKYSCCQPSIDRPVDRQSGGKVI